MAKGFEVLKAAIEAGWQVRIRYGSERVSEWYHWNPDTKSLEGPSGGLVTLSNIFGLEWEIESAPNRLFMEAIAAMDYGEVVERVDAINGGVSRWRRRAGVDAYEVQDFVTGAWEEADFTYMDIHADDWHVVRDVVQEPDNRPKPADVLNFMQAFHAHFPALSYGDWRYVGEELLTRWPDIVRRG